MHEEQPEDNYQDEGLCVTLSGIPDYFMLASYLNPRADCNALHAKDVSHVPTGTCRQRADSPPAPVG